VATLYRGLRQNLGQTNADRTRRPAAAGDVWLVTARMMQFLSVPQTMPDKRAIAERRHDFREIYDRFQPERAAEQAARCEQCGIPFCQVHCPLHNNIPDWLRMTAEGRLEEAYELASATNNMPEICGRICPQDRLCEGNCVIEKGFESVTIGAVEKHITEVAFEQGWVKPPRPTRHRSESIGVIGAGPAGLAVAEQLRKRGYQIDVYDRYDRIGGLLMYGIPNFKLEKTAVERRTKVLAEGGIRFHLGAEVGSDVGFDELRARHDALFIGTGVYRARDIAIPGVGLAGVVPALDYLVASNRKGLGDAVPAFDAGALNAAGKRVVVIGGGDTAMDCVRTAVRQGAVSVQCLYRRDRANMPGSMREVKHAEEEGVEFLWQAAPEACLGDDRVSGVRAVRMRLGAPDASGRQRPEPLPDSSFVIEAELVIKALGFDPEDLPALFGASELQVTRWGTVRIDWQTMMTPLEGVFAGGDIVRGASLVVWGVRDGRDAAEAMHEYLQARAPQLAAAS
jgi:glutamate synthase (NADPH) small chain